MSQNNLSQDASSRSRRSFLGTSALAVFLALVVEACGGNTTTKPDASSPSSASPSSAGTAGASPSTTHNAAHASTAAPQSSTTIAGSPTSTASSAAGAGAPTGAAELRVAFTYVADTAGGSQPPPPPGGGGGKGGRGGLKNAYVAVWIEDAQGLDVRPVSLFYQEREAKYLNELRRFSKAEKARVAAGGKDLISTYSSATRQPGTYDIVWDGKAADGKPLPAGSYFLCIESAREHGPYSLIREAITIGSDATELKFADQGELQQASATFVAKA
jgi:hypothetical protein